MSIAPCVTIFFREAGSREALITYCFERDRLQAVRKVGQMNPALAAEGSAFT